MNRLVGVALAAALLWVPGITAAQEAAIQGIVADAGTGRPLEDVAVTLELDGERAFGTFTDRNGFYQIPAITPDTFK